MITRPVLKYQGGKFRIRDWIISFFPTHKIYVESFGGVASVLLQKKRSLTEIYNDINGNIVNLFRVLRDKEKAKELKRLIELTPWSRQEYYDTNIFLKSDNEIERARALIVRAFMGIAAGSAIRSLNGFCTKIDNDSFMQNQTKAWATYPEQIALFCERLQNVTIENRPAIEVIQQYDTDQTLHYVDPPYVIDLWNGTDKNTYSKVLDNLEHEQLLNLLREVKGFVVLSGYDNELYNDILHDWHKESKETRNQTNDKRLETVWISQRTLDALNRQKTLFS